MAVPTVVIVILIYCHHKSTDLIYTLNTYAVLIKVYEYT
jgi:hypothetical protein